MAKRNPQSEKAKRIEAEADKRLEKIEALYEADRKSDREFTLNASQIYAYLSGIIGDPDQDQAIEIVNAVERDPHLYLTTGTNCSNFGKIQCIALGSRDNFDN